MMECLKSRTALGNSIIFFLFLIGVKCWVVPLQGELESLGRNVASPAARGERVICLPKALVAFNLSKRCKLGAVCQNKLSK